MKIPNVNADLRRFVIFKDLRRIFGCLIWATVLISGALAYNANHKTYPPEMRMVGWRMALWVAIALLSGAILFRVFNSLFDRTRVGIVTRSGLSNRYSASRDPGESEYDFRTETALRLQLENGKHRRVRFEQKNGFYQYYHEGERVIKLHGLPYPINLDPTSRNGHVCAACGAWRKQKPTKCEVCGLSLIDPNDLKEVTK